MTLRVEPGFLPPSSIVEQVEIKQAIEGWERATAEAKLADRERVKLERGTERIQAQRRDAEDLAAAIESGKPTPKARHAEAFEQQLADVQRRASATAIVAQNRWGEVVVAFEQHGDALIKLVNDAFEAARKRYVLAVESAEQAHSKLAETQGLRVFTSDDSNAPYRDGMAFINVSEIPIPAMSVDSGRLPVASVFSLLRECGAPPPARPRGLNPDAYRDLPPEQRHVPLAQQGRSRAIAPPGGPAVVGG